MEDEQLSFPTGPPAEVTSSVSEMEAMMKRLLEPLQEKVAALEVENQTLRETVQEAQSLPGHLVVGADFAPDPRAARSVVIATRPVRDTPEHFNKFKSIVDTSGLSVNTSSPLSRTNRENQELR